MIDPAAQLQSRDASRPRALNRVLRESSRDQSLITQGVAIDAPGRRDPRPRLVKTPTCREREHPDDLSTIERDEIFSDRPEGRLRRAAPTP